jgi:hypothetical protein
MWKEVAYFKVLLNIHLQLLSVHENLNQDRQPMGQELKLEHTQHEVALNTQPQYSVRFSFSNSEVFKEHFIAFRTPGISHTSPSS